MKQLGLLAGIVLTLAGCASTAGTQSDVKKERVADAYRPTGTFIPIKKSQRGIVNTSEVDKQTLENERMNGSATINKQ